MVPHTSATAVFTILPSRALELLIWQRQNCFMFEILKMRDWGYGSLAGSHLFPSVVCCCLCSCHEKEKGGGQRRALVRRSTEEAEEDGARPFPSQNISESVGDVNYPRYPQSER